MPRKPKQLNKDRIKGVTMFVFGLPLALLSGITGIGAQIAMAPTISSMLGFVPERVLGTSIYFTLWAAIGGVAGAVGGGLPVHLGSAALIAIGGVIGVLLTVGISNKDKDSLRTLRRIAQSVLFMGLASIIYDATRFGGMSPMATPFLRTTLGLGIVGVIAGAVSNGIQAPMGVILVPGLIYLGAVSPPHAILISLVVTVIASVLPTLGHVQRQTVDSKIGRWLALSGLVGGAAGGLLLAHFAAGHIPVIVYGLCGLLLAGWTALKLV